MKKILSLIICLFLSFNTSLAVTKTEDRDNYKLLVTGVEFGEPFNISSADLAGQRADWINDDQGESNLVIRFRFTTEDEKKITDLIDGGFIIANRPEIKVITDKDPITYVSDIDYALVDESKFAQTGALTRAGARTEVDEDDETTYTFRTQDLRSRNNRIPIFEMQITSALSFSASNFDIVFNFYSPDETIENDLDGSIDQDDGDDSDDSDDEEDDVATVEELSNFIAAAIYDAADTEVLSYDELNFTLKCGALDDIETEIDICSTEGLQELSTKLQMVEDNLDTSISSLDSVRTHVKTARTNKYISKIEAASILRKISCAKRIDKTVLKAIKKLDNSIAKKITKANPPSSSKSKSYKKIVNTVNKALKQIEKAYEKCKHRAVDLLNAADLASNETLNNFPEDLDDYEVIDDE